MISVIVITKNESHNIDACLDSVRWSDDIIVVDAESADDTAERARRHTPHVHVRKWEGFSAAKTFAVGCARHQWVLWLDADERVMPELADEISRLDLDNTPNAAYTVARRAYFLGRWIRHSGWYPGRVARLFRKDKAQFTTAAVHEGLAIHGNIADLSQDLLHYTDPNLYHYFEKFNRYTTLAAEESFARGKRSGLSDLLVRPAWLFLKMYVLRRGFLDGMQGLILALLSSAYVFTKYSKLWEAEHNKQE
ncbi:MAG TPA: glycosyltransferase family 2 protein [Bacteroidota bacterium]|nr:glycosyltransferase family 2 protein [Bacteroidota bacterium]